MSMLPVSRIELKKGLDIDQVRETTEKVHAIAGHFNVVSRGEPVVLTINTTNPQALAQIRALPHVEKVAHQL